MNINTVFRSENKSEIENKINANKYDIENVVEDPENKLLEHMNTADSSNSSSCLKSEAKDEIKIKTEKEYETSNFQFIDMNINELQCDDIKEENDACTNKKRLLTKPDPFADVQAISECTPKQDTIGKTDYKYQCKTCLKICRNAKSLGKHISLVHAGLRPFACQFCQSSFNKKHHLSTHLRIHTGEKPYACDICDLRFAQLAHKNKHQKRHEIEEKNETLESCKTISEKPQIELLEEDTSQERSQNTKFSKSDNALYIHQCDICQKTFKYKSHLKQHDLSVHERLRPFGCKFCDLYFTTKHNLAAHERTHTGEKPFACDICDRRFVQLANMHKHRELHENDLLEKELVSLNADSIDMNQISKLGKHHTKRSRPYQCNICEKSFRDKSYLKTHISSVHRGHRAFPCQICHLHFATKHGMQQHVRIHTGEKPFACEFCGRRFRHSDSMKRHQRTHKNNSTDSNKICTKGDNAQIKMEIDASDTEIFTTGTFGHNNETLLDTLDNIETTYGILHQFTCRYCNLRFTTKQTLKTHERIHTREKPYGCNICDRRFLKLSQLNKHQKRHMNDWREKISETGSMKSNTQQNGLLEDNALQEDVHQCDICQKTFKRKNYLRQHVLLMHNELLEDKTSVKKIEATDNNMKNVHQCDTCQKKFKLKSYLRQHISLVHKKRQFACQSCDFHSASKYNLQKHERIHTGEKPFSCDICGRTFRHSNSRKRHQATHRNNPTDSDVSTSELQCKAYDLMQIKMETDGSDTEIINTDAYDQQLTQDNETPLENENNIPQEV